MEVKPTPEQMERAEATADLGLLLGGVRTTHWYAGRNAALSAILQSDQQQAELATYAREASKALADMAGGGSEMFTRIGDEYYAEPEPCRQRHREKMANMSKHRSHAELQKRADALAAFVDDVAKQHLREEMEDPDGNYEGAYEIIVTRARAAYRQYQEGRKDG